MESTTLSLSMSQYSLCIISVLVFSQIVLAFSSSTIFRSNSTAHLKLIHRDSPLSPLYNPNLTAYERVEFHIKQSMARWKYLQNSNLSPQYLVVAPLRSDLGLYTANFSIGIPPFQIEVIVDTGSSLTWIQCLPCIKCFDQKGHPIFDPIKSSTYIDLSCEDDSCKKLGTSRSCGNSCQYEIIYGGKAYSKGSFALETFTFDTADGGNVSLINVAFGCGHDNGGVSLGVNGLLGIGPESVSLINQVSQSKFSYCLAPQGISHLQFGSNPSLAGKTTPILGWEGCFYYYVQLDDISIDSELLHIPTEVFKPKPHQGLILDSGRSYDLLDSSAFDPVLRALQKKVKLRKVDSPFDDVELCYEGTANLIVGFPTLTYHFIGGAELLVEPTRLFEQVADGIICLVIMRKTKEDTSFIGQLSQQNHVIGYDLRRKLIYVGFDDDCQHF